METPKTTLVDYLNEVSHASARFQYLEEILKMHLAECFRVVELSVRGRLVFEFTYADVRSKSLGGLINLFRKYNGNQLVLELLQKLPEQRNYIAHQAYLLTQEEQEDSEVLAKELEKVREISKKANEAVMAVSKEARTVEGVRRELENDKELK